MGTWVFQPAPPCEGATPWLYPAPLPWKVSTRAPVRGGDATISRPRRERIGFNPRPRARGRLVSSGQYSAEYEFQPAPPCEGATPRRLPARRAVVVSTRAPVRGGDSASAMNTT